MDISQSKIPAEQLAAYEETQFQVLKPFRFILRIGVLSEDVRASYREFGVQSAAYLTAWNPNSEMASQAENETAQAELERLLTRDGFIVWRGRGIDPSGDWPGEDSVLVLGISKDVSIDFGRQYRQNAIVWLGEDATPELVLLK